MNTQQYESNQENSETERNQVKVAEQRGIESQNWLTISDKEWSNLINEHIKYNSKILNNEQ